MLLLFCDDNNKPNIFHVMFFHLTHCLPFLAVAAASGGGVLAAAACVREEIKRLNGELSLPVTTFMTTQTAT